MKLILLFAVSLSLMFGADKDPKDQPTKDERIALFQLQRAWLQAQIKAFQDQDIVRNAAADLDDKAAQIAKTYKCLEWKADFTCVVDKAGEKKK